MQPPSGRRALCLLIEVFQNARVILATMWSFLGSTRFIHPAPARGFDGMIDCIAVALTITVDDDSPLYRV
jgi:hypothetical protein